MAFNDEGGAGVGGWLAFFVLIMAIFSPAAAIVGTYATLYGDPALAQAYGDSWATIQMFSWGLVALVVGLCWYIAWRLHRVQVWQTVRVTIAGIWIIAIGAPAADFVGISLITGIPIGDLIQGATAELFRPLVFGVIWTAYFLRSKRVANTYPRDEDPQEVAEVFN